MSTLLLPFAALIIGMLLLIWSADRFVDGAAGLARNLGLSPLLVGMLVVGFGTSAPELLVSATAAFQGNPGLGIGNAIGSNITNIALVLGVTAIVVKLPVHSRTVRIELPVVFLSGALAFWLVYRGDAFSVTDGWILFSCLIIVMAALTYLAVVQSPTKILATEAEAELPTALPLKSSIIWTIVGLIILVASSKLLVWSATDIAEYFGVSDLIIGLTVVAIGTSLPELAASISSAVKGETDFAVGTVVGSNLFNTLGVLALPGIIGTASIPYGVLSRDFPVMMALTALLLLFGVGCWQKYSIGRWKGLVLLSGFALYETYLYFQATAG